MSTEGWVRRRWFDFRMGHSIYLVFVLTFVNFILITYRLLIERVTFLQDIFNELWIFVFIFIFVYAPAAILIGHWHRKTQLKVDATISLLENPLFAKWLRIIMDMQQGVASKKEIEEVRNLLSTIEKKGDKSNDVSKE